MIIFLQIKEAVRATVVLFAALLLLPSCSPLHTTKVVDASAFKNVKSIAIMDFSARGAKLDSKLNADSLGHVMAVQLQKKLLAKQNKIKVVLGLSAAENADLLINGRFGEIHRGSFLSDVSVSIEGSIEKNDGSNIVMLDEKLSHEYFSLPSGGGGGGDIIVLVVWLAAIIIFLTVAAIDAMTSDRSNYIGGLIDRIADNFADYIVEQCH